MNSAPKNDDKMIDIQELKTATGTNVWLVENHDLPLVRIEIAFRSGSAFEPAEKSGLASLTASMLDEGAGEYGAKAFQEALENIGGRFGARAGTLNTTVKISSLSENLAQTVELAALALQNPSFNEDDVERIRESVLSGIKQSAEDPGSVAAKMHKKKLYGDHGYGRPVSGEQETVEQLTAADLRNWHQSQYTKANAVVSVVGAVSAEQILPLIEQLMSALPEGEERNAISQNPADPQPGVYTKQMPVPQATVKLGHLGISREDPDYYKALVLTEIFSGGRFSTRLMDEVREKRGLVYGIGGRFTHLPHRGDYSISLATNNNDAAQAIDVVITEMQRIRDELVDAEHLQASLDYLLGSFPLRLDSHSKILGHLTVMQLEGLGVDYLDEWPQKVAAVTVEDLQQTAQRLYHPDQLVITIVGDGAALEYSR